MNQDQVERLKRVIEKIYKQYIDERTDRKATIADVARLFNIPIDETRLTDYQIVNIDFNDLLVEIFDAKTDTAYTACYSRHSEVLGFVAEENETKFINVNSNSQACERSSSYYIGNTTPALEKMKIRHNGYGLFFKKTIPNVINLFSRQDGVRLLIGYFKEEEKKDCDLSTSIYKTNYTYKNINSFERSYVNNNQATFNMNIPDKFFYDVNGNVCTGLKFNNKNYCIEGACFEKIDDNILLEALMNNPTTSPVKNYSKFDISSNDIAILYAGYYFSEPNRYYHDLEITKINDGIKIKYKIEDRSPYKSKAIILDTSFTLSSLNNENAVILEVDNIIAELQKRFNDDEFIKFVINELLIFKYRLEIKNGLSMEVLNPLSPKLLFDRSFEEIYAMINANKDEYFRLAAKQFEAATHITPSKDNMKTKVAPTSTSNNDSN